ncbi:helix-turn-helix domain-containing protein [Fusibacter sp. JL216-2]|uniref:helix-turn-helix domain-containing protein n=1 Tax=Fusibacter sp. JL216-2 TaxID=3071453 RepID=UPI003D340FCF
MDSMGKRLKKLRLHKGISQTELADALDVGQTTIANYEADTRQPNLEKLTLLADYFHISVDELIGRTWTDENKRQPVHEKKLISSDYDSMASVYMDFLIKHEKDKAQDYIINLRHSGVPIKEIYSEIFVRCLHEVGRLWEKGVISIGEEHYISEVTKTLISHLSVTRPKNKMGQKSIMIINLYGEDHDIPGKILSEFMEGSGVESYYMGSPLPLRSIVENLLTLEINVLAFSITMDENINKAKELIDNLRSHPKMKALKVIVGGQALDKQPEKWLEIGADGYAESFDRAVEVIVKILEEQSKEPDHEEK